MEDIPDQDEKLRLASQYFLLTCTADLVDDASKVAVREDVLASVAKRGMASWYTAFSEPGAELERDSALIEKMNAENAAKMVTLEATIKDAEENLGESEVRDAELAKAALFDDTGDKENAIKAYLAVSAEGKGAPVGCRIDCALAKIRLGLASFEIDHELTKKCIAEAHLCLEQGGDWERRNRLKVYEALHLISKRDFKQAGGLLLGSLATFTSYEVCSYNTFVFYTVVCAMVSLDRVSLKEKVVNAPEILTVIDEIPQLANFLNSLYNCDYKMFFRAFPTVTDEMRKDRYMVQHVRYFEREMRIVAYTQFLESYRSVSLESFANAFGVSKAFIDTELSRFIATGRINAKIDEVADLVETNRADARNTLYQSAVKKGDELLNRIQKLSRVINV